MTISASNLVTKPRPRVQSTRSGNTPSAGRARLDLLLVDDDEIFAQALATRLKKDGIVLRVATSVRQALERVAEAPPALALIDYRLPDGTGIDLASRLGADAETDPVRSMMITAFGSIDGAVQAMRAGCVDYVVKESQLDEIALRVKRAVELAELRTKVSRYQEAFKRSSEEGELLGTSPPIEAVRKQIRAAAASPETTVLIQGETGTGKQLVARAIHAGSARRDRPYVELDCTTLMPSLLESELFGHERGAFTGAHDRKLGLLEMAAGGSLVLDEVGELEPSAQSRLLRFLQERRFRRVGSVLDREVDVRIVAVTNRVLAREVAAGRFREDLYYRLRVLVIEVPPLRERGDDVVRLGERFVREFGRKLGKPLTLGREAVARLRSYPFFGNVRELRAVIEQAVVRAEGDELDASLLPGPPERRSWPAPRPPGRPRDEPSDDDAMRIRAAMERHYGNQSRAAEELGISRYALKR